MTDLPEDYTDVIDQRLLEREQAEERLAALLDRLQSDVAIVQQNQQVLADNQGALDEKQRSQATTLDMVLQYLADQPADPDLRPWSRDERRTKKDWVELADWMDMMAAAHSLSGLPACWPAHEHLVLEIDAARAAWQEAIKIHQKKPGGQMAHWYAYVWQRLVQLLDGWDTCRTSHRPDPMPGETERAYLPALHDVDDEPASAASAWSTDQAVSVDG